MAKELLKRKLGRTDLEVSTLSFGTMNLKYLPEAEAEKLLHTVLDLGINYIDTSRAYGNSEERIGRYLSSRRDEVIIATKCGCNPHLDKKGGRHVLTFDRPTLERNLENSLRALKTDCIDIWQLHGATPEKLIGGPAGEVVQFMEQVKQQGKVRYIGVSIRHGPNTEAGYPSKYGYDCIQEYPEWGVFDLFQIVYGGMVRTSEDLLQYAAELGAAIIARGVVRDYFDNFPELFNQAGLNELLIEGEDRRAFLIRYALSHRAISSLLIGTNNPEHLKTNILAAAKGSLAIDRYLEAKKRFDSIGSQPGFLVGGIPASSPTPVS